MTLRGEIPIEQVMLGDRVVTLSGNGATLKPVTWLGRVTVDMDTHPDPMTVAPVIIRAGAIEEGMPVRDLVLSPDHGVSLEDDRGKRVLVPAICLVNGATIVRGPAAGTMTYYQVELEAHDVLMADGMAVESYLENEDRTIFAPGTVISFAPRGELPKPVIGPPPDFTPRRRKREAVNVVLSQALAAPLHARGLERAKEMGFALTDDPGLSVATDAGPVSVLSASGGRYVLQLPAGARRVVVETRPYVPAHTNMAGGDTRVLGIPVRRVAHAGAAVAIAGDAFEAGFLGAEGEGAASWRWTAGPATLRLKPKAEPSVLEIDVYLGWSKYWVSS